MHGKLQRQMPNPPSFKSHKQNLFNSNNNQHANSVDSFDLHLDDSFDAALDSLQINNNPEPLSKHNTVGDRESLK